MDRGRWNFSLRDVLVAMIALGVCFAIFAHWVNVTREDNRQSQCVNNLRQLGLAIHNHHDSFKRLPYLTSTQLYDVSPGSLGGMASPPAGYGWSVRILPYIECSPYYISISQLSGKFQFPAFSLQPVGGKGGHPVWSVDLDYFRCPSYSGPRFATAPEYRAHNGTDASGKPFGVAVSNYVALTASHLGCIRSDPNDPEGLKLDGMIVPGRGKTFRDIVDGTWCTLMACESREAEYASWYDGTVGWVVAVDPNSPEPTKDANGFWMTTGRTSIQLGPDRRSPKTAYLPTTKLSTMTADRKWGPSSEHRSGVVNHLTGDAAVHAITAEIDPTLYLQLTTRAGREPATVP